MTAIHMDNACGNRHIHRCSGDMVLTHESTRRQFRIAIDMLNGVQIGRRSRRCRSYYFIDLSSINAWALGVSRCHAIFSIKDGKVMITGLGGMVIINHQILPAYNSPVALRHGDILKLAMLELKVTFEYPPQNLYLS